MKLDNRYEIRVYISPVSDPEMAYDDFGWYEEERKGEPFLTRFYIYDNEIGMSAVECDTGAGWYDTIEEAIECYKYQIKIHE